MCVCFSLSLTVQVRDWYAAQIEHFLPDGVDFWWNDEGETQWFDLAAMAVETSVPSRSGSSHCAADRSIRHIPALDGAAQ